MSNRADSHLPKGLSQELGQAGHTGDLCLYPMTPGLLATYTPQFWATLSIPYNSGALPTLHDSGPLCLITTLALLSIHHNSGPLCLHSTTLALLPTPYNSGSLCLYSTTLGGSLYPQLCGSVHTPQLGSRSAHAPQLRAALDTPHNSGALFY